MMVEGETAWAAATVGYPGDPTGNDDAASNLAALDDAPTLPETIGGFASVAGKLKEQLKDLVKVNEALELNLERTRKRAVEWHDERYRMVQRIHEMEQEVDSVEDLKAEVRQLSRERDTLADKVRDLSQALSASEQRLQETGGLLDRFRAERDDASAEASCLNSQFSRAMKVIGEIRNDRAAGRERQADLEERIRILEEQLDEAVGRRSSFKSEHSASRSAQEQIRQSILAASRESRKGTDEE